MSFNWCRSCKYMVYCTFPRERVVTECDEFEDVNSAPAYDWNLSELNELMTQRQDSEPDKDQ